MNFLRNLHTRVGQSTAFRAYVVQPSGIAVPADAPANVRIQPQFGDRLPTSILRSVTPFQDVETNPNVWHPIIDGAAGFNLDYTLAYGNFPTVGQYLVTFADAAGPMAEVVSTSMVYTETSTTEFQLVVTTNTTETENLVVELSYGRRTLRKLTVTGTVSIGDAELEDSHGKIDTITGQIQAFTISGVIENLPEEGLELVAYSTDQPRGSFVQNFLVSAT